MRIAYLDCISGISGDMTLGALIDAGAPADQIERAIQSLGLGELRLRVEEVRKCGFRAVQVVVEHPPEHAHRHLHHIEAMIDQAEGIAPAAKAMAKRIFLRLGEAEAKVHGTTIQKVHFHEVGAVDSIADIVGSAVALDCLGIEAVEASPVPTGHGTVTIAHGRVSIPAPATAELLCDVPIAASEIPHELTTPTGAAILKATVRRFGPVGSMTVSRIGYGAGTRDLEDQANVLRVLVGQTEEPAGPRHRVESDQVWMLQTNIDDSPAEEVAACAERLLASGAIEVYQTPCLMKKGRAGVELTVLAAASRIGLIESVLFSHTSTIGVRRWRVDRHKLFRRSLTVETPLGPVCGKCVWVPEGHWRFAVEYDDAAELAAARDVPLAEIRRLADQAFRASGEDRTPPPS